MLQEALARLNKLIEDQGMQARARHLWLGSHSESEPDADFKTLDGDPTGLSVVAAGIAVAEVYAELQRLQLQKPYTRQAAAVDHLLRASKGLRLRAADSAERYGRKVTKPVKSVRDALSTTGFFVATGTSYNIAGHPLPKSMVQRIHHMFFWLLFLFFANAVVVLFVVLVVVLFVVALLLHVFGGVVPNQDVGGRIELWVFQLIVQPQHVPLLHRQ